MSKAAKSPSPPGAPPAELPFEAPLQKLEAIVEAMETDALPLETMLARYEEGMRLAEVCQAKLAAAEIKIQQLEQTATGESVLKPLDLAPSAPQAE